MIQERRQQEADGARAAVTPSRHLIFLIVALCFVAIWSATVLGPARQLAAQDDTSGSTSASQLDGLAPDDLKALPGEQNANSQAANRDENTDTSAPDAAPAKRQLNLLTLLFQGGWLMLPLALMAVLLVMLVIERLIALRRSRIIPSDLVEELGDLGAVPGVLDPRRAYRLCQEYPSPAATAIRTMLLKIGRPQTEIEHAVAETNEREADRLYASVRWLNLMTAVAPLIGLLGTVWGMIWAFYETTQMAPGTNKAEHLAEGIYIALVTTLGGLTVAIPAAICSHFFEARIIRLFHEIDELLFNLLPQVERFEGRLRTTPHSLGGSDESSDKKVDKADPPDGTRRDPAHVR